MQQKIFDIFTTVLITTGLFALFTLLNLEHSLAFLTPVLLAVFIMRYEVKDAIIPAVLIFVVSVLISFLIKGDFWYHGIIFITGGIIVGFLHGGLSKKLSHLKELAFVVLFDISFGFITALIFYLVKDPVYAINVEFTHYFDVICDLVNLNRDSIFGQNFAYLFMRSFPEYIIAFGIIEATLTHLFIHLVLKFIYRGTKNYAFSDLNYTLPKSAATIFIVTFSVTLFAPFLMTFEISKTLLVLLIIISSLTLGAALLFVHQGVVVLSLVLNRKLNFNLSPLIYIISIALFVPFALLGVVDSFLKLQQKLLNTEDIKQHNYFKVIH